MPPMPVPANLPELVRDSFQKAKASGALMFFPSKVAVVPTHNNTLFQVRCAPSLASKPKPKAEDGKGAPPPPPPPNPFVNPPSALKICDLHVPLTPHCSSSSHLPAGHNPTSYSHSAKPPSSPCLPSDAATSHPKPASGLAAAPSSSTESPSHFLVLNKFAVVPQHFILATTVQRPQTHLLDSVDLLAAYSCLRAYRAYYRGRDAPTTNTASTEAAVEAMATPAVPLFAAVPPPATAGSAVAAMAAAAAVPTSASAAAIAQDVIEENEEEKTAADEKRAANREHKGRDHVDREHLKVGEKSNTTKEFTNEFESDLFVFFNSGSHSGASQPHRHLQLLPVRALYEGLMTVDVDGTGLPGRWKLLPDTIPNSRPAQKAAADRDGNDDDEYCEVQELKTLLPFVAFALPLRDDLTGAELRHRYLRLYDAACAAVAQHTEGAPPSNGTHAPRPSVEDEGKECRISYNMCITSRVMVIVPRLAEGHEIDLEGSSTKQQDCSQKVTKMKINFNGTMLAGTALVKSEEEFEYVVREGREIMLESLQAVGVPWSETVAKI